MSEEELKQIWDNLFNKLNETEKTYLAIISNEKNKKIVDLQNQLQQKENIIKEVREYCMKYENWEDDCVNDIMKILDKANDREDK